MRLRPSRLGLRAVVLTTALALVGCAGGSDTRAERPGATSVTAPRAPAPSATEAPPEPTSPDDLCSTAAWTLDRRIRNLVFVSLPSGSRAELDDALAGGAGGVFVTSAAVPLAASGELATATRSVPIAPLVSIDEEGGRVQRLRDTLPRLPSARTMAAGMTPEEVETTMADYGASLRQLGITMDAAPVVDLATAVTDEAIGDRTYGETPDVVVSIAGTCSRGLRESGVTPTLKHFPGQGSVVGDSHDQIVSSPPIDALGPDLEPYRRLLPELPGAAVMVGHVRVPGLTGDDPASISRAAITGLLRSDLGFDGLVLTDDLGAMRGILDEMPTSVAAARAVAAGVDMPLVPVGALDAVVDAVTSAVANGEVTEAQVTASSDRVLRTRVGAACG